MISPAKPSEGSPCNGCGVCCAYEVCPLPEFFGLPYKSGSNGPCAVLEYADGRWWCGLVRSPEHHLSLKPWAAPLIAEMIRELLGDGTCDASVEAGVTWDDIFAQEPEG